MRRLFFICNALDDETRTERQITTDSPAASRKIFLLAAAMRQAGVHVAVVSMGRGRQNGSKRFFGGKVVRVGRIPVIYLPFFHFPVLSELLSLMAFLPVLWRLRRYNGRKTALFYNRLAAYLPALVFSRTAGFNTVLDLEDGATNLERRSLSAYKARVLRRIFDACCSGGALLACDALAAATILRPVKSCYGTTEHIAERTDWLSLAETFLFGGTVSADTGGVLLVEAIRQLRRERPVWAERLRFEITGKGDYLETFKELAQERAEPIVVVHGRTSDAEYKQILARTIVGLALKPNAGQLAETTFPSKVIEFASHDILVLTTDISDVRKMLGDGALYVEKDDVDALIEKLRLVMENKIQARQISLRGMQAVAAACSPEHVGSSLRDFLFRCAEGLN